MEGFFLQLFRDKKLERKFILSLVAEVIRFFDLKKVMNKDIKSIIRGEKTKHKKSKEIKVGKFKVAKEGEEVCSYS
jgi:hypothetical protein